MFALISSDMSIARLVWCRNILAFLNFSIFGFYSRPFGHRVFYKFVQIGKVLSFLISALLVSVVPTQLDSLRFAPPRDQSLNSPAPAMDSDKIEDWFQRGLPEKIGFSAIWLLSISRASLIANLQPASFTKGNIPDWILQRQKHNLISCRYTFLFINLLEIYPW